MPKKKEIFAAIDVGSNSMRMAIAQIDADGNLVILEDLRQPTHIGRDTFSYGRIQVKTMNESCDILKGFVQLLKEYKVKNYRAVCTSGIREAENKEYVLEQILIRTGLQLEIINNAQERFLMYKAIRELMFNSTKLSEKNVMIMDIRAGGIEISVYSKGTLEFTEYIRIGSLRLREILSNLEKKTLDFPSIMEEFIESRIQFMYPKLKNINIDAFIGLGGELRTIIGIVKGDFSEFEEKFVKKSDLEKISDKIQTLTTDQIIKEFNLSRDDAEVLLPCVILFNKFLHMTLADRIIVPMVSLRHGILVHFLDEWSEDETNQDDDNDIINSVWYIAEKYLTDSVHCKYIENISLKIFDNTKKYHRLNERARLYLRVASILHDVGKFVSLNKHDIHSMNIIRSQDVMGFSDRELEIVANIARYHSEEIPHNSHENYLLLEGVDQIIVSKLAGIIRLAEALDISHRQKINNIDVFTSGNSLVIDIKASEDTLLEEWSFASHMNFFEEVMGIQPIVRRKKF